MARYALRDVDGGVVPYEIVRVPTDKTLVIREMACTLADGWRPRLVMGFCENQDEQQWVIEPDPDGICFKIRWSKHYGWRDSGGNRYRIAKEPSKRYRFGTIG